MIMASLGQEFGEIGPKSGLWWPNVKRSRPNISQTSRQTSMEPQWLCVHTSTLEHTQIFESCTKFYCLSPSTHRTTEFKNLVQSIMNVFLSLVARKQINMATKVTWLVGGGLKEKSSKSWNRNWNAHSKSKIRLGRELNSHHTPPGCFECLSGGFHVVVSHSRVPSPQQDRRRVVLHFLHLIEESGVGVGLCCSWGWLTVRGQAALRVEVFYGHQPSWAHNSTNSDIFSMSGQNQFVLSPFFFQLSSFGLLKHSTDLTPLDPPPTHTQGSATCYKFRQWKSNPSAAAGIFSPWLIWNMHEPVLSEKRQ